MGLILLAIKGGIIVCLKSKLDHAQLKLHYAQQCLILTPPVLDLLLKDKIY